MTVSVEVVRRGGVLVYFKTGFTKGMNIGNNKSRYQNQPPEFWN